MEVCASGDKIPCPDISGISGPSKDMCNSSNSNSRDVFMNGCKTYLTKFTSLDGVEISTTTLNISHGKSDKGSIPGEDYHGDLGKLKSGNSASEKCFSNCAAFVENGKPKSSVDEISNGAKIQEDGNASGVKCCAKPNHEDHCSQSILKPTPQKLKSAIKGSREKQGIAPPKKLNVTWASDVYDPTPTSVSHVPSNKNQRNQKNGKRHGKWGKHKASGKSSRTTKGKGKKQTHKNNGNGSLGKSQPPIHNDILVVFNEHQVHDLNSVSPPDPFCGSSYIKKSMTNLHFPVTEAK